MAASTRPHLGEPLALDLLNTVWMSGGEPVDFLVDSANVGRWLADNDLDAPATATVGDALVETREAIRAMLTDGSADAVAAVNAVLSRGACRVHLDEDLGAVRTVECDDPAWRPAVLAAVDIVELLERHPGRIRRCEHPNCVLWFLDTSRNGTRRWHSMATCGNRAKAQRHYARAIKSNESHGDR